jgi:hypothetical protein
MDTPLIAQRSARGKSAGQCVLSLPNKPGKRSMTTSVWRTAREEIFFLPRSVCQAGHSRSDNMRVSSAIG